MHSEATLLMRAECELKEISPSLCKIRIDKKPMVVGVSQRIAKKDLYVQNPFKFVIVNNF